MADDPNPSLRAELLAAIAVLTPQIRGLDDLEHVSISGELKAKFSAQKAMRSARKDRIQAVLDRLDATFQAIRALEADGYPNLPPLTIDPGLFAELEDQKADIETAVSLFQPDTSASNVSVTLGAPTEKPKAAT